MSDGDFLKRYGPWAVIAGGSEGLGVAFAHRLAKQGLNLVLIARKPEPLEALAAEVRKQYGCEVRTMSLDITAPDAVAKIIAGTAGCEVGMLVHNAGSDHNFKPFMERPVEESERMTMLNVMAPLRLVRHFAESMVARKKGGIILLSSMASMGGYPGNLVYASTKAFSNIFAEGLWYELGKHGVDVLGTIIGLARTPAMERMGVKFDGPVPSADPYDVVDEAFANLDKGPTIHACGMSDRAKHIRSLPRADAVRTLARDPDFKK
jgi:short-subunit dehydrogenase